MKVAKSSAKLASNRNKLENCVKSHWTNVRTWSQRRQHENCIRKIQNKKQETENRKQKTRKRDEIIWNFTMRFSFQFESRFVLPIAICVSSCCWCICVSVSLAVDVSVSLYLYLQVADGLRGTPAKRSKDIAAVWRSAQSDWTKHFSPCFHAPSLYLSLSLSHSLFNSPTHFVFLCWCLFIIFCFIFFLLKIIILFWFALDLSINYPGTQTIFLIGNNKIWKINKKLNELGIDKNFIFVYLNLNTFFNISVWYIFHIC